MFTKIVKEALLLDIDQDNADHLMCGSSADFIEWLALKVKCSFTRERGLLIWYI